MSNSRDQENEALGHPEYWDRRYEQSDGSQPTHEWFKSFDALAPLFERHLYTRNVGSTILHLGSGDSTIPNDLAGRGYTNQLCVDFSPVVVKLMSAAAAPGVQWMQADVRKLDQLADRSIDVAFDKGTLDAMIYGSPWDPPDEVRRSASSYMSEVSRVLKDDGVFIYVTFRQPHFIKPLVNADNLWDLETEVLREGETSFDYHAFIMSKSDKGPESAQS